MTGREFMTNVAIILLVMAIGAILEILVPMFADKPWRRGRRAANLGLTAVAFLLNWLLASAAAVAALTWRPAGLLAELALPFWAHVVLGILVLDFSVGYLSHRTMHMWPAMWRFHRIHHSDPFVDVTTTYRTHPVETVWRFFFAIVPIWVLGLPAEALLIQRLLQATNGVIEHSNIKLFAPLDRVLSLVWVTPNVHKMHHSRLVHETNSNYANLLTIYDRLLGTYTPAARAATVSYGLDDAEALAHASFGGLMTIPFRGTDTRVSGESYANERSRALDGVGGGAAAQR
jgi:sterol desaturase/sphingolipid hydroxylase (fatty acid hydroxylase superfamily)